MIYLLHHDHQSVIDVCQEMSSTQPNRLIRETAIALDVQEFPSNLRTDLESIRIKKIII